MEDVSMVPRPRPSAARRRASNGLLGRRDWRKSVAAILVAATTYIGCRTVPLDVAAPPVQNLNASPARTSQLETGRLIFTSSHKCARCHRPKPIVDYSPEYWTQSIMPRESKKAKLSDVEEHYVLAYILTAHAAIPNRPAKR